MLTSHVLCLFHQRAPLCGGDVAKGTKLDEQAYLDLEREGFLSLCGEEKSIARMESILMTGKPLRN